MQALLPFKMTGRRPIALTFLAAVALVHIAAAGPPDLPPDPFAWLQPEVSIDSAARRHLDQGDVVVRILPSADGALGILAAGRVDTEPERLAAWATSIADLKKGPHVLAVKRFSDPPVLGDLADLMLDDGDVESVRSCKPGRCELKIDAAAIESLRQAADAGGPQWKDDVRQRFRQLVLDRVNAYRADGFAGLPPYVDRPNPIRPQAAFSRLLDDSPYLRVNTLSGDGARAESYFYWSKEDFGIGKPIVAVTHVDLVRGTWQGAPSVTMIGSEILATHYRTASLGLTAVIEDDSGQAYLVYINRSQLDVFGGLFNRLKRSIAENRLKDEGAQVFDTLRRRLESGPPSPD